LPCASPLWNSKCNVINTACIPGAANEGCDDGAVGSGGSCVNCYRAGGGDPPPEEGGNRVRALPYVGCFGLLISHTGFLSRFGVEAGDLLMAINKRPIRSTKQITTTRTKPITHVQYYRPSTDEVMEKEL
jgi:hypothetical protein